MNIQLSDHFTTKRLLRFALPSIVMMIFTSFYGVVDGIFVSNFTGSTPFASLNLVWPFIMILGGVGFILGVGGTALVSYQMGQGDKALANRTFSLLVYTGIGVGLLLSLLGELTMEPICRLMGASDAMLPYCLTYGRILMLGLTPFVLQNMFQTLLVGWGFVMFAWEITRSRAATALSFLFLFLNGGLGFLYTFDMAMSDPSRLHSALYGFYQAPANMPALNLRWSNILCDMLLPQRALLPGWMLLSACLWLMTRSMQTDDLRAWILLGILAGAMPMIHAHSLFALAMISFACMAYSILRRRGLTRHFLCYALITAVLVLPQALYWILPQAAGGSMHPQFDWVNWENGGLRDEWLWFWVKNVGPLFLVFVPSYFTAPRRARPLMWGALLVFAAADLVVFQKNVYDNNKIFYAAFLAALPCAAYYLRALFLRLKGFPGRGLFAAVFIVLCLTSGVVTCAREAISSYPLYSREEVRAMDWVRENTPKDALFLTGDQYDNPVCALGGRNIFCGTGSFLYYHSIDYWDRAQDQSRALSDPSRCLELCRNYGVNFIFLGDYEMSQCGADPAVFAQVMEPVFTDGVYIFAVPEDPA